MAARQDNAAMIDFWLAYSCGVQRGIRCAFYERATASGTPVGLGFFGNDGVAVGAGAFHTFNYSSFS
jgi:hypothetical protein